MTVSAPLTTLHFYQSHLKFLSFLFFCYLLFYSYITIYSVNIQQLFLEPKWVLSQQPMWPKAAWVIESEATRARGIIIVSVKSNQLVKKYQEQKNFSQLTLDFNPLFAAKKPALIAQQQLNQSEHSIDNRPLVGFY